MITKGGGGGMKSAIAPAWVGRLVNVFDVAMWQFETNQCWTQNTYHVKNKKGYLLYLLCFLKEILAFIKYLNATFSICTFLIKMTMVLWKQDIIDREFFLLIINQNKSILEVCFDWFDGFKDVTIPGNSIWLSL